MKGKFVQFGKQFLAAAGIILLLQLTGLLGSVSYFTQSAVMKTGLLDANALIPLAGDSDFDYNFTIKDLNGKKISFDQFKGKVVFLNMWATWCGPCRAEMPTIQELYDQVDHDKIAFVMLSLDKDQDKEKIVRYIQNKAYTFPVYQPTGYLSEQLSVRTIPTTFVISKDGKIATKQVGTTNFNTTKFKKFMDDLVAKGNPINNN